MNAEDVAPYAGVGACLALLAAFAAPYLLVTSPEAPLTAYYGAGPIGANAVAFFSLVAVVVFLAGRRGRTEPDLAAGIALVLGVATLLVALVWALSVDETVLFSFPASASWIEFHPWVVVGVSALVPAAAGVYARAVLN
ncbi:hypothetical protein ACFO0N_02125 [Halobium salinum]|uniref:Uncharacterized protein n=1 Tax=Halobium salinum TaxID=1364940 RepID=A0ABD5P772_9EURY|nr:hypothetical protein [Halobium salinum]